MPVAQTLTRRLALFVSMTLTLFLFTLGVQAEPRAKESSLILKPMGGEGASWPSLSLNSTIEAEVTGPLVKVTVTQSFKNPGTSWAEGTYRFPMPETGSVRSLEMQIGDRLIKGTVKEKEEAQRTYETAAANGQRASLLSENRPNIFTTKVANIGPGEQIDVRFSYMALADLNDSTFSWILPQSITPRYDGPQAYPGNQPDQLLTDTGLTSREHYAVDGAPSSLTGNVVTLQLNGADMISAIDSPTHALVETAGSPRARNIRVQTQELNQDIHLSWTLRQGAEPKAHLFTETVNGEDYALLMLVPPKERPDPSTLRPRDITFIVDVSGSMHGAPLEAAKAAMTSALNALRPQDHFNILVFAGGYDRFFSTTVAATAENIASALDRLSSLSAGGGTEAGGPLYETLTARALPGYLKQVVFVTDGAIAYETRIFDLLLQERELARVFTIGTGAAPNHWFLRKTAEYGRGTYLPLPYGEIQPEPLISLMQDMEAPQLTGLALDWSLTHTSPAVAPDLYGSRAVYITAKRKPNASSPLVTGRRADGSAWATPEVRETQLTGSGIDALWARREIDRLQDLAYDNVDAASIRAQALPVALKHQIVSPYTSFVAVEERIARPQTEDLENQTLRSQLPAGTSAARFFAPQTGTDFHTLLGLALLILTISVLTLRPWRRAPQS